MVVRGRLAFDDQGRLVEIAEDAADPNNPQPSEIDPVEFDELIAQTAAAQNLDAGQLVSSLNAAGYDITNVGSFDSQSVSTDQVNRNNRIVEVTVRTGGVDEYDLSNFNFNLDEVLAQAQTDYGTDAVRWNVKAGVVNMASSVDLTNRDRAELDIDLRGVEINPTDALVGNPLFDLSGNFNGVNVWGGKINGGSAGNEPSTAFLIARTSGSGISGHHRFYGTRIRGRFADAPIAIAGGESVGGKDVFLYNEDPSGYALIHSGSNELGLTSPFATIDTTGGGASNSDFSHWSFRGSSGAHPGLVFIGTGVDHADYRRCFWQAKADYPFIRLDCRDGNVKNIRVTNPRGEDINALVSSAVEVTNNATGTTRTVSNIRFVDGLFDNQTNAVNVAQSDVTLDAWTFDKIDMAGNPITSSGYVTDSEINGTRNNQVPTLGPIPAFLAGTLVDGKGEEAAGAGNSPTPARWNEGDTVENVDDNTLWQLTSAGTFSQIG